MDTHRLKIFVSVFKNRSFSRASEQLHLSQPTISEHIKSLEETLGTKLFDRLGRGILPTPQATLIYQHAVEVLEKIEGIKTLLDSAGTEPRGELIIGASTIPGTYILPQAARCFRELYSQVSFTVVIEDSGRISRMVSEHELLLGFLGARMSERGLLYQPFIRDELLLVAKKGSIDKDTVSLEELKKIPLILREEGSGTRKTIEYHLRSKKISGRHLKVVATLGSSAAVKEAVKTGLGASILSRLAIEEEINNGILEQVRIEGLKMDRHFYIITPLGKTLPPLYQTFLDFLTGQYPLLSSPPLVKEETSC